MTLITWLQATRDLLIKRGWTRGMPRDGKRCLYMTMEHACSDDQLWNALIGRALYELKVSTVFMQDPDDEYDPEQWSIVAWNDQQSSVDPVLALLDNTITRLQRTERR